MTKSAFNTVTSSKIINCDDKKIILSNLCYIKCLISRKSSIAHYKVQISCQSQDFWNDFSYVNVHLSPLAEKNTDLVFLNSDFPQDFNLYNFTSLIGLKKVISLKIVKPKLFSHLSNKFLLGLKLLVLEIHCGTVKNVPEFFFQLVTLTKLKITKCALALLKFNKLDSLKMLNLSGNRISTVKPKTFDNLELLEILDMSSNKLTSLPTEIFKNFREITIIDLHSNSLRELPADLFFLKNSNKLREIYLSSNELNTLPILIFRCLKNLSILDLSNNKLLTLSKNTFKGLNSLRWLSLSRNNLRELPSKVFKDNDLTFFDISSNQLEQLKP